MIKIENQNSVTRPAGDILWQLIVQIWDQLVQNWARNKNSRNSILRLKKIKLKIWWVRDKRREKLNMPPCEPWNSTQNQYIFLFSLYIFVRWKYSVWDFGNYTFNIGHVLVRWLNAANYILKCGVIYYTYMLYNFSTVKFKIWQIGCEGKKYKYIRGSYTVFKLVRWAVKNS